MNKHKLLHNDILLNIILETHKGVSKVKAKQIIKYHDFIVNGQPVPNHPNLELKAGDVLDILSVHKKAKTAIKPGRNQPISIYFEDEYLIVALKPPGIVSSSDSSGFNKHSYHRVLENFLSLREGKTVRLWVVHRIDREVEGLLMFAKQLPTMERIKDMWPQVTKKYLALTEKKPNPPDGIVENWLRDGEDQVVEAFDQEVKDSRLSKTEYHFLRQEGKYSLLEITLHTGRKNQIRVHLSGQGCPIVGDRKYGADGSFKRQIRLASVHLEFVHPFTQMPVRLKYDPPVHFFHPSQNADEHYKIV